MARLNFAPSPWAVAGGLGGGLAEGVYMGQNIAAQRQQLEQNKLHQALMLLAQGAKSDDPALMPWFAQIAQMAAPQLKGMPMPTPTPHGQLYEQQLAGEMGAQRKVAESILGRPLTEEEAQLLVLKKQPKEPKEMVPWQRPDGSTIMISGEKAAQLEQSEILRKMMIDARGGRGGAGDETQMMVPDPSSPGGFKLVPIPKKTKMAPSWMVPTETERPIADQAKLAEIADKIDKGQATEAEKQVFTAAGGVPAVTKPGKWYGQSLVTPSKMPSTKKKGKQLVKPPPAVTGGGTDEEPPE